MREYVEGAVRSGGGPRMPDTPERSRLERERSIREVIFGMQDGVLTTLGIVTGVGAAGPERATILLTGSVALIVGTISMAVGEYLGGKSEREVVRNAIALEQREMLEKPDDEFAEQVAYYRLKGFTPDEATMIVNRLATNPDVWLHEMMRDEFGIDLRIADGGGGRAALAMGGSFACGAVVPLIGYFIPVSNALSLTIALVLAALALFGIGAFAGQLSNRNPFAKGAELLAFGTLVFAVAFAAGHLIPALFGHPPVGVG
jgi:VIT1/CCC1 family predicted Fe2+/Mn2+ transporter